MNKVDDAKENIIYLCMNMKIGSILCGKKRGPFFIDLVFEMK